MFKGFLIQDLLLPTDFASIWCKSILCFWGSGNPNFPSAYLRCCMHTAVYLLQYDSSCLYDTSLGKCPQRPYCISSQQSLFETRVQRSRLAAHVKVKKPQLYHLKIFCGKKKKNCHFPILATSTLKTKFRYMGLKKLCLLHWACP